MAEATKSKFSLTIEALDKFSAPFKKMGAAFKAPMQNLDKLNRKIDETNRKNVFGGAFFERMRGQAQGIADLTRKFATFGAVATGGILALTTGTAAAASGMTRMARTAGVSTEAWQQYSYAAEMAGVESEDLESVLKDFSAFALMAGKGATGEMEKFATLGIDFKTLDGEIKDNETLLLELADKIKYLYSVGRGDEATGMLDEVFGDSGSRILKLLEQGSSEILHMRLEAEKIGLVFDEDQLASAASFNKSMKGFIFSIKGLSFQIANKLFPPTMKFLDTLKEWVNVNKDDFVDKFAKGIASVKIEDLVEGTKSFLKAISLVPKAIIKGVEYFKKFSDFMGGAQNVLFALAAVITGPLLLSILAFGKALLLSPVGWFLGAVAAIGTAAYLIYDNWSGITKFFSDKWQGIKDAFNVNWTLGIVKLLYEFSPIGYIVEIWDPILKYFKGFSLKDEGLKIIKSFMLGVMEGWKEFTSWFSEKYDSFMSTLSTVGDFFSFDNGGPSATSNLSASLGEPVNMGSNAMPLMRSHSETVEKQEVTLRVKTDQGVSADLEGEAPSNMTLQTGAQGFAGA